MSRRKSKAGGVRLDARGFDITLPETTPTLTELLTEGTAEEVREALLSVGLLLRSGIALPPNVAQWIGERLERISNGEQPNAALRLNTKKRRGVRLSKIEKHMIDTAEGVSREEAAAIVARFDPTTNTLTDDPEGRALERMKKRRQRASRGTK